MAEVELQGLSEVLSKLSQLESKQLKSIIIAAVRAGSEVIARAVRTEAPVASRPPSARSTALTQGFLRADITTRVSATTDGAIIGTITPGSLSKHVAKWVNEGHRKVYGAHVVAGGRTKGGRSYVLRGKTRGNGTSSGMTSPNEFVSRAFNESADPAARTVEASIIDALKRKGVV